jgi:hypothetical protein
MSTAPRGRWTPEPWRRVVREFAPQDDSRQRAFYVEALPERLRLVR